MDLIVPDHRLAGAYATRILLRDVSFGAVQGKLLSPPATEGILDYRLPKVTVHWTRHMQNVSLILPLSLIAEAKQDTDAQATGVDLAMFSVVIRVEYKLLEQEGRTIEPDHLPHVLGTLGYMHAWPYFRSDVQWLTTKLGFPALVLPVVLSGEVSERVLITRDPVVLDESSSEPNNMPGLLSASSGEQQETASPAPPPRSRKQSPRAPKPRRKQ